jgi:hypothetical protein
MCGIKNEWKNVYELWTGETDDGPVFKSQFSSTAFHLHLNGRNDKNTKPVFETGPSVTDNTTQSIRDRKQ